MADNSHYLPFGCKAVLPRSQIATLRAIAGGSSTWRRSSSARRACLSLTSELVRLFVPAQPHGATSHINPIFSNTLWRRPLSPVSALNRTKHRSGSGRRFRECEQKPSASSRSMFNDVTSVLDEMRNNASQETRVPHVQLHLWHWTPTRKPVWPPRACRQYCWRLTKTNLTSAVIYVDLFQLETN